MDEWLGIIERIGTCLFNCANKRASYVYKVEDNLESLRGKWHQLEQMYDDINIRIQTAENTGEMQRKKEIEGWRQDVHNLQKEIKDVIDSQEIRDNKCLRGYCLKNCVFSYKVGKKIVKNMIPNVEELLVRGRHFDSIDIANKLPPKPVSEMPNVETIGLDLMLNEVWKSIENEKISIIGLYGMAGVGKTTLLKRIHNEFGKRKHDFTLVLWVVVSRDCDISRIMNDIRNRIGIDDDTWRSNSSQDQRVAKIYQVLNQKRFVMMIDDIWDKLELEMVGVPNPKKTNNKSKVLFTTRIKDVCAKMQAQKEFEVKCLSKKEALDLFCQKVGDETLKSHTEILNLAREMTNKCAGLPLALTTVGSAMAGIKNIQAWREAKSDLGRSPWTMSEREDKVFSIIKFSFDRLPDDTHKSCFLYCALYPEDYAVKVDDLILRWIGEGFLGESKINKSLYDMYEQGESIIEKLKLSCMLEGVEDILMKPWVEDRIKMHDVIRDMALWIARDKDRTKDKVLIQGEALTLSEMNSERLNVVEKISIRDGGGREWKVPACPNLITLCVGRHIQITHSSNLKFMKRLKVLDLSGSDITHHPKEIGMLLNLEYLNLSYTRTPNSLLIDLKNLKKLRVFLMEYVMFKDIFPYVGIESLEQLKVFKFSHSSLISDFKEEKTLLEKLESLPKLEEMHMEVTSITGMHKLLESNKLRDCTRHFSSSGIEKDAIDMPSILESFSRMKHLENITLYRVTNIIERGSSITGTFHLHKLRKVWLGLCNSITHLTWLRYAPLLERLLVLDCDSLEELIRETKDEEDVFDSGNASDDIFPNLRLLILQDLPALKGIHKRALDFPSLKVICVTCCFNLRKLPLNSSSAAKNSLVRIQGETEWWNNLEWEDTDMTTKDLLRSKFQEL